ncbi:hypothetical protein V8D89_009912 [Ganoderma adspersum]
MGPSTTRRKPGGRGARFPQEAADIMLSYYHNVSTFPDEAERVELAKKVKSAAPSCGHYTAYHVYQYFANLRHRAKNGIEPSLPSNAAVAAVKALDAPRCEETRPSVKTKDLQKKRVDDRKTTRDAKSHMLCGARKRSRGIVATEGGDDVGSQRDSGCMRTDRWYFPRPKPFPRSHPSLQSFPVAQRHLPTRSIGNIRPRRRPTVQPQRALRRRHPLRFRQDKTMDLESE